MQTGPKTVVFGLLGNVHGHTIKVWWVEELHVYAP